MTDIMAKQQGSRLTDFETLAIAGLIFAVYIFSVRAATLYLPLSNLINSPTILNPPVLFYVGQASNATGKTMIPLTQNFCPQNATTTKLAAANPNYAYYTFSAIGQDFNYSLIYNASQYRFAYAVVPAPFKLLGFKNSMMTASDCLGWPGALGNATIRVQAPNSTYVGPFYGILYFSKS